MAEEKKQKEVHSPQKGRGIPGAPFRIVVTEFHPKPNPKEGIPIWSVESVARWLEKIGKQNGLNEFAPLFREKQIDGKHLISKLRYHDIEEFNTFHRSHFWRHLAKLRMVYLINQEKDLEEQNILQTMSNLGEWRHYDGECISSEGEFDHPTCGPFDIKNLGVDVLKGEAYMRSCVAFSDEGQLKVGIPKDTSGLWVFHEKKQDEKAFLKAVARNKVDRVRQLLCRGADYNSCDRNGRGAFLFAAESGHSEITQMLVNFNIKHQTTKAGETALLLASRRGNVEVVKILLEYLETDSELKEKYRQKSARGYTALMAAANRGHTEVVELLLKTEHARDVNVKTQMGWTPLTAAAHNGHFGVVEKLLSCGEHIDLSDDKYDYGNTLLMLACRHGHVNVVKALLSLPNVEIDKRNEGGGTALLIASYSGHSEIVKLLLENDEPADIEARDNEGKNALMWAASGGYADVITVLLNNHPSAIMSLQTKGGFTALSLCATRGYLEAVQALINHGDYQNGDETSKQDIEQTLGRLDKSIHDKVHRYLDEVLYPENKVDERSGKKKKTKTPKGRSGEHSGNSRENTADSLTPLKHNGSTGKVDAKSCSCCVIS